MTILPHPVAGGSAPGAGARYNLVAKAQLETLAGLGGLQLLTARLAARGHPYLVRRLAVQGPAGSRFKVYTGEPSEESFADGSQAGALDIADYYQPLYVENGLPLVGVWTDRTGAQVTGEAMFRIELEEMR